MICCACWACWKGHGKGSLPRGIRNHISREKKKLTSKNRTKNETALLPTSLSGKNKNNKRKAQQNRNATNKPAEEVSDLCRR